jgi:hypothetical protein
VNESEPHPAWSFKPRSMTTMATVAAPAARSASDADWALPPVGNQLRQDDVYTPATGASS